MKNSQPLTTSLTLLSFLFLSLLLTCTGTTSSDPNTTDSENALFSITKNYLGIHSVHFDIAIKEITHQETLGFIITPKTAPAPTATEVTNKDGYITRVFSPTQTHRSVFLFTHIGTDMVKTFASDEFRASVSSNDVLSPGADYTLYIYQQSNVVYTHDFTTTTFATASTRTPSTIERLNGGLLSSSSSPAPLVIEYKTNEFLFFPYIYHSTNRSNTSFDDPDIGSTVQCITSDLVCNNAYNHSTGFAESLSPNITFAGALQAPKTPNVINQVANGSVQHHYNIKPITE